MELGNQIKKYRSELQLSQDQLAEHIYVSRQTISNWENGKSLPDVISLIEISDLYQISLDDLLKGDKKMMKKIEKDTDTVKSNRTMMNVGWAMLICSFIFTIWNNYSGNNSILQFISAAAPWVMLAVGIACIAPSISGKKKD